VVEYLKHPVFNIISELAKQENKEVYVIGGFVRDALLGRQSKDIDIVVVGNGVEFAEKLNDKIKGKSKLSVFKNFGTAMIKLQDWKLSWWAPEKSLTEETPENRLLKMALCRDDQNRRGFYNKCVGY
jgi:poly(A) polymerase